MAKYKQDDETRLLDRRIPPSEDWCHLRRISDGEIVKVTMTKESWVAMVGPDNG